MSRSALNPRALDRGVSIGSILREAFGVLGRNFIALAVLAAFPAILSVLLDRYVTPLIRSVLSPNWVWLAALWNWTCNFGIAAVYKGAAVTMVYADITHRPVRLVPAVRVALPIVIPVAMLSLLTYLLVYLGLVLLIVPGILLALRWYVALPVRVIEGAGIRQALRRSTALSRGHRWKILGLDALWLAAIVAVSTLPVMMLFRNGIPAALDPLNPWLMIITGVVLVISLIGVIVSTTAYAALLRDKEGGLTAEVAALFD